MAGLGAVKPVVTAFTLALDTPDKMANLAANRTRPLFKLELRGDGDMERVRAVRLIVDANESWNERRFSEFMPTLLDLRVELIEQPLPADADDALARLASPIPICADKSCRTVADLDRLHGKYAAISIKLDKVGGLTEALLLAAEAKRWGLRIMAGGGIGTSLGVAPALLVAQQVEIVDLDGPLRLASDRAAGLRYEGSAIYPADPKLWGTWLMLGHWPVDWSASRAERDTKQLLNWSRLGKRKCSFCTCLISILRRPRSDSRTIRTSRCAATSSETFNGCKRRSAGRRTAFC
jgi:L-alanine-DL-glutamate epimerase-like enolase superfamily enzyme